MVVYSEITAKHQANVQVSCWRERKIIWVRGQGQDRETHIDSGPELLWVNELWADSKKATWDWPRLSLCVWQLCSLVCLWRSEQWDMDLHLVLELDWGNHIPKLSCPAHPQCLVLPQLDMTYFVDSHGRRAHFWKDIEKEWIQEVRREVWEGMVTGRVKKL